MLRRAYIISAYTAIMLALSSVAVAGESLTVAVASSLYPAMQQQVTAFEKTHDVSIHLVSGSTGRLYNQIIQGAPFDVFIAADQQRPALLTQQGKALAQYELGLGYLSLVSAGASGVRPLEGLEQLKSPSIRHIAIANPDVAPFGKLSREILEKQGLWQALKHKFIYTQNAMQAAMMVNKGLVDAGFIPVSADLPSIASIHYQGVLLADKSIARLWLKSISSNTNIAMRQP